MIELVDTETVIIYSKIGGKKIDMLSREMEDIKMFPNIRDKNNMLKIKNTLDGINNRLDIADETIKLKDSNSISPK